MKTYEEFNWNLFKKKEQYNDYIGLDDINALDEFNEISGQRYENIVKYIIDKDGMNQSDVTYLVDDSGHDDYKEISIYFKNFNKDWVYFGYITIFPGLKFKIGFSSRGELIGDKISKYNMINSKKIDMEQKKLILDYFNDLDDQEYNEYMEKLKMILRQK